MSTATGRIYRPDPRTVDKQERCHRGRFSARHVPASTVIVTVEGDVDAANSRFLAAYVERQIGGSARLMLDLQQVSFFGTAGYAALHHVGLICSRYGTTWTVRMGPQVSRLLAVCDPDGCLPIESS